MHFERYTVMNKTMLKFLYFFSFALSLSLYSIHDKTAEMTITPSGKHKAMQLMFVCTTMLDSLHSQAIDTMCFDLKTSGQFNCLVEKGSTPQQEKALSLFMQRGYPLVIFLSPLADGFEWRMYDTCSKFMLTGSRITRKNCSAHMLGHVLAHELWKSLTGEDSSFTSSILFVRQQKSTHSYVQTELCTASFDGKDQQILYRAPAIVIAPIWNKYITQPVVLFSEFTHSNVRLSQIIVGQSKPTIVLDMPGTSVGVAFGESMSSDGIVYARSGNIWRYTYNSLLKIGTHTLIVKESTICASPTTMSNGNIIYCSGGCIKQCDRNGKNTKVLSKGYAVAPAHHKQKIQTVYSARIKGLMQLYVYDHSTKKNTQITYSDGNKIDPCWSPCGHYVAFSFEKGSMHQIALQPVNGGDMICITSSKDMCSYPSWS